MKRLILLLLILALALPLAAQAPPDGFAPIWVEKTGQLPDDAVKAAMDQLARENPSPQEIIVLVHGYATPREASTAQFRELSSRIRAEFAKGNRSVSILGLQWDSDVGSVVFDYGATVTVARGVGRYAGRQLLLALRERFPNAHVSVLAHSMGCEVTLAALKPQLKFDEESDKLPVFQADRPVNLDLFGMAGSDLDYDVLYKGGNHALDGGRVKLLWMTVAYNFGRREDEVLKARETARGLAAGSVIPRLTAEQYDRGLANKQIVFDNQQIPEDHAFLEYYSPERLSQMLGALIWIYDNKAPKPTAMKLIDEVMFQPDLTALLAPYLDHPHMSPRIYALWRLEKLLCGGSQHLADEDLRNIANILVHKPREIKQIRPESPCQTVKQGFWPTKKMMERAGFPEWADNP